MKKSINKTYICKGFFVFSIGFCIVVFFDARIFASQVNDKSKNFKSSQPFNSKSENFQDNITDNPQNNLRYGRKALEQKQPDKALLAYERVLMYDKNNIEAQLGLGMSLYQLKMLSEAQQTLQILLKNNLSKNIYEEARILLDKVNNDLPKKITHRIYFSANGGYDSNASVATDENFMQLLSLQGLSLNLQHMGFYPGTGEGLDPILWHEYLSAINDIDRIYLFNQIQAQTVLLEQLQGYNNKKIGSFYFAPQIGDRGSYSSNEKITWYWDINANYKDYFTADDYNNLQANVVGGFSYYFTPKYSLDASFYYQEYIFDNNRYQESPMVTVGLQKAINSNNFVKLFTTDGITSYPQDSSSNLNIYQIGLQLTNTDSLQNHILISQIITGKYVTRDIDTPYNSSNFCGFNFSDTYQLTTKTSFNFGTMYQHMLYKEKQFIDADRERDDYLKINGTISYSLIPSLIWSFTVTYTNNFSNIFIKKYDRLEIETGINYEF